MSNRDRAPVNVEPISVEAQFAVTRNNLRGTDVLGRLAELRTAGMADHIGVSNFNTVLIEQAQALSDEPLLLCQVEYHPYLNQDALLATLAKHGMALTAYSPIAQGKVFKDPVLQRIGAAHGKNPGQVTLRWLVQQGVAAIPRSTREANVEANLAIFDFELSDAERAEISGLARPDGRRRVSRSWAP